QDNLQKAWEVDQAKLGDKVPRTIKPQDAEIYKQLSEQYKGIFQSKESVFAPAETGGDMLSWGHYHYGRFSFGNPGWQPSVGKFKYDSTHTKAGNDSLKKRFESENDSVRFALWMDLNQESRFINWKEIKHPAFPEKKVEVGGFMPYAWF